MKPELLSNCPSRDQLMSMIDGLVSDQRMESLVHHLDNCSSCETDYAHLISQPDRLALALRHGIRHDAFLQEPQFANLVRRAKDKTPTHHPIARTRTLVVQSEFPQQIAQYRLLEVLGHGGMGIVFRARDCELDCVVAVKLIRGSVGRSALERFKREKRALGQLNHANIVRARSAGVDDGVHFLAMDYVDGIDLSTLVRERGPLAVSNACELVAQAARGLQYIHEQGQVHRDLKPSNLMLDAELSVKILDLGLAQLREVPGDSAPELTGRGVMGTLEYMAPEQLRDPHNVDIRADIYSLGVTLYKLLAGRTPYNASELRARDEPSAATTTGNGKPSSRPNAMDIRMVREHVPDTLAEIILSAVALDPDQRFKTPQAMCTAPAPFGRESQLEDLIGRVSPSAETPLPGSDSTDSSPLHDTDVALNAIETDLPSPSRAGKSRAGRQARLIVWAAAGLALLASAWVGLSGVVTWRPGSQEPTQLPYPQLLAGVGGTSADPSPLNAGDRWANATHQAPFLLFETYAGDVQYGFEQRSDAGLRVSSREIGMIECGSLGAPPPDRMVLDIMRLSWKGSVGMFLGYQPVESDKITARVQVLEITKGVDENRRASLQICRKLAVITREHPPRLVRDRHGITWEIPWNLTDDWNRLEVEFDQGAITSIRFNKQDCQRLVDPDVTPNYSRESHQGLWGIFNGRGTSWFRMAEIIYPPRSGT